MGPRATRRLVTAAVAATVALTAFATSSAGAVSRPAEDAPDHWDRRVAPIAAQVEKLRGLEFEHPVPVQYLSDAAFRKRIGAQSSKLTKRDRRQVADLQATLRAFGLIDADTDIVKSLRTVSEAGTAAYYDIAAKKIVIRGKGPLDADHKATLAHELTHVLQDQHFDLQKLRADAAGSKTVSSGALTGVIEGDAERIKDKYLRTLSRADRTAYDAATQKAGDAAESEIASAPELVKAEFTAPYVFGPLVLDVLTAHGGNHAVDDAFGRGAPTDKVYLDPTEALHDPTTTPVRTPSIPKGAHRIGEAGQIGAFDLYTLLASRIDRQTALTAADGWTGDRYVTYRSDGRVCARATIATAAAGTRATVAALQGWSSSMPEATITAGPGKRRTTVTSCESDAVAAPTTGQVDRAIRLLAIRDSILGSAVQGGAPTALATCVAHRVVQDPVVVGAADQDTAPTPAVEQQLRDLFAASARDCRSGGA